MQISGATKKQHDSPRLNRHAAFLFIISFQAVYIVYISLHLTFFASSSQNIAGEPQSPPNLSCFSKNILPFVGWLQAARFPYSDALHIFPQNIHRYFMFFACKTHSPPGRSRIASLSTNIICRIFSGMCYFLRIFFDNSPFRLGTRLKMITQAYAFVTKPRRG